MLDIMADLFTKYGLPRVTQYYTVTEAIHMRYWHSVQAGLG